MSRLSPHPLLALRKSRDAGRPVGLVSVCSAHPLVLEAALTEARDSGSVALIEATCNQVNQDGGYTGMRPDDFSARVRALADLIGLPRDRIVLGGDHLGPNPWTRLPAATAMARAGVMVAAYVAAGFEKIHLDCSMRCADDPAQLTDALIAERAGQLCAIAEQAAARLGTTPYYVVGTEVPPPGGAIEVETSLAITTPEAVRDTIGLHQDAFSRHGVATATARIIGVVVQPGVEFGSTSVHFYDRAAAVALPPVLDEFPGLLFEAHSTDYQRPGGLADLVSDGFGILKVGPWLTFAMREALYGLDAIRQAATPNSPMLSTTMERLMLARPAYWQRHYAGSEAQLRLARHYSYSDRIRYYWDEVDAQRAVTDLLSADYAIDETMISQYCGHIYDDVRASRTSSDPRSLVLASIGKVLSAYRLAVTGTLPL
ncbi:class II D-tagatose-bisphosphate aldolase, non-catalytic subunit [Devosia rhodophyticola]|uniref:Class II D-tagatose-bisphosphate aldolase, non-catalytic subunit n=1 Tax=Devosia rhodophyticola TaxID=3026423 RepID=A0ABY7YTW2_9HYPH|nr:class II D-tagatose-bisphosphate aldolase, non-catalytic subunit [Devosia rhodophyticola]WDR04751.1 class II D-tagatose-bisphosphate aldolase, non-catalytic subunit [Devosia rhodophyticola]